VQAAFVKAAGERELREQVRLPGKGSSNCHGARPVHLIITMIQWIRTSRLSIKNSLSARAGAGEGGEGAGGAREIRTGATREGGRAGGVVSCSVGAGRAGASSSLLSLQVLEGP